MTNVNQAPLPRLSKAPLVRASLVKRRYIKYLALPSSFFNFVKHGRISIIFGIQSPEEMLHQKVVNLATSPEICHRTTL